MRTPVGHIVHLARAHRGRQMHLANANGHIVEGRCTSRTPMAHRGRQQMHLANAHGHIVEGRSPREPANTSERPWAHRGRQITSRTSKHLGTPMGTSWKVDAPREPAETPRNAHRGAAMHLGGHLDANARGQMHLANRKHLRTPTYSRPPREKQGHICTCCARKRPSHLPRAGCRVPAPAWAGDGLRT